VNLSAPFRILSFLPPPTQRPPIKRSCPLVTLHHADVSRDTVLPLNVYGIWSISLALYPMWYRFGPVSFRSTNGYAHLRHYVAFSILRSAPGEYSGQWASGAAFSSCLPYVAAWPPQILSPFARLDNSTIRRNSGRESEKLRRLIRTCTLSSHP